MAGGKQTPRQRMIGIMYLVLLGLIALSVPDSLMDAFKNIKVSLDTSRDNVKKGINDTYSTFKSTKLKDEPVRAAPILEKAQRASKIADALNNYVQALRDTLMIAGDGIDANTNDVGARENLDISPRVMITNKHGEVLRQKIIDTRQQLLALLDDKERKGINFSLNADAPTQSSGPQKSWEEAYFGDGIPLGATLTTLAKIQTDTKNAENEVVKKILGRVDQALVNLDTYNAVAVAPTSYVLVGQPYTADVFLTASDSKIVPDIRVGGSPLQTEAGKGKYVGSTSTEGLHTWSATIHVKQTDGTYKDYVTPPQTYMVARPSATVSPTKMNVLYIGLPNPLSISAPGIAKENLRVSMSGGSISGSNGNYTATVSAIGTATISVSGELAKGKVSPLGSSLFRVKRIPDPKAEFAGRSSGNTSASNLKAQDYVFATLKDFEFDAKFNVTHFVLMIFNPHQDAIIIPGNGNQLTSEMHDKMKTLRQGSTIVLREITAVGPDGTPRVLDAIVLNAN